MTAVHPEWRPGMDPRPQGGPPPGFQMSENPPPMNSDPAYPPMPGYEGVGFGQARPMPPPPMPPPQGDPPPQTFTDLAKLDEEACRSAMIQHVSEHCCYGSKPAKEMSIMQFEGITALHYVLETFGEGRNTKTAREPYRGGPVDGPENGQPPPPWVIPCAPNQMFHSHNIVKEVPHTSVIQPCGGCDQRGWNWCHRCGADGRIRCGTCGGDGVCSVYSAQEKRHVRRQCHRCHGSGQVRCSKCGGDGRITCSECQGYRMLRCYIELTVSFTNHKDDYILETTDMPDELVREVGGTIVFEDVQMQVFPITMYQVKENQNFN
ncbi:protein SSUH2 homolog [Ruditapes philippinarum]|uniref:protein SSUH2 homolog n=1 Tax=Ruditapes philippinarum TaxID=129788 RepID=UPI00295B8291|nr:protein SSUH2 homolog [Ruditapes philippinarum]